MKARFDDLFERSSELIVVHDRRGRVSTINRACAHAVGYSVDEVRTLDPQWIFRSEYLDVVQRLIAEGPDAAPQQFRSELIQRRGGRVPIDVQTKVLAGDNEVVGVISIARDLGERERLENELRQAQKMEAVGRLATGIAHDFNNLITVLLGYSDELIENAAEGSETYHAATAMRAAAERASALTEQLLAFTRRQASAANVVDLNHALSAMEDMLRRLVGPEIRLELSLAPGLAAITADESQIGQVIMNLVVNARDAMPAGGTLSIATASVDLDATHLDVIPGPHVELCVADTGQGITADVRARLFEPFFTTKERGHGTGLGLSMVHAIVRQYGGSIVVDSAPGQGTRFHVYFPRQAAATPAPAPARSSRPVTGQGVVLLAEDDPAVRRLVVAELGRRGFTVLAAGDGAAALDLFTRERDRVDVVVTDIVMPNMNGVDLARSIVRLRPELPILFVSGHPERAGAGLIPDGVTNLLMKPFSADTLASRIKELIGG